MLLTQKHDRWRLPCGTKMPTICASTSRYELTCGRSRRRYIGRPGSRLRGPAAKQAAKEAAPGGGLRCSRHGRLLQAKKLDQREVYKTWHELQAVQKTATDINRPGKHGQSVRWEGG